MYYIGATPVVKRKKSMKTRNEIIFDLSCPYNNIYQGDAKRYLFVCSAGLLRSATAATVASQLGFNARSCGSEHYALVPLSVNLLTWAHTIFFVNEENYLSAQDTFTNQYQIAMLEEKSVVWDIEDQYDYMNPELVAQITENLKNVGK